MAIYILWKSCSIISTAAFTGTETPPKSKATAKMSVNILLFIRVSILLCFCKDRTYFIANIENKR
jgi:hypothetical protein